MLNYTFSEVNTIKVKALIFAGMILLTLVGATALQSNSTDSMPLVNDSSNANENEVDVQKNTITSAEAKAIAQKHIEEPNASVGEVETVKVQGKETKVVPVIHNGKRAGEISIDSETGIVSGGAGGAPS
jgi:hypothetical protein